MPGFEGRTLCDATRWWWGTSDNRGWESPSQLPLIAWELFANLLFFYFLFVRAWLMFEVITWHVILHQVYVIGLPCPTLKVWHSTLFWVFVTTVTDTWFVYGWINKGNILWILILRWSNLHEWRGNLFVKVTWLDVSVYNSQLCSMIFSRVVFALARFGSLIHEIFHTNFVT